MARAAQQPALRVMVTTSGEPAEYFVMLGLLSLCSPALPLG